MKIGGLQKLSLLDFADRLSAIVWTLGCDFRCPFCYNTEIVLKSIPYMPEDEVLDFLNKRKEFLEAVVITGGEPTLQPDLQQFLGIIKDMGYLVKIDSNGMRPGILTKLIDKGLVDYISMDIKAPQEKYDQLAGVSVPLDRIEKSIKIIKASGVDYEFRTTLVPMFLNKSDVQYIAEWVGPARKFCIQQFENRPPHLDHSTEKLEPYAAELLFELQESIEIHFDMCEVRNI